MGCDGLRRSVERGARAPCSGRLHATREANVMALRLASLGTKDIM